MPDGRLVVCPTPIGNLEDVTLRLLATLAEADLLACEDTRHTRVLLERHGVHARELISLHEHNERERAPAVVARATAAGRSGEHTSELQSHVNIVCRLLLLK